MAVPSRRPRTPRGVPAVTPPAPSAAPAPVDLDGWLARVRAWEDAQVAEHGWFYRVVFDPADPRHFDAYTVGVARRWPGQLDVQVVLRLPPAAVHGLFWRLIDLFDQGQRLAAGDECREVLANAMPVRLVAAGPRLRVILPDPAGEVRRGRMAPAYARQYDGVPDEE